MPRLVLTDRLDSGRLQSFRNLLGFKQDAARWQLTDHLLYFNPMGEKEDADGYFSYQSPSKLLNDPKLRYRRRMWVQGTIAQDKTPSQWGHTYNCTEQLKFIKRLDDNHYVCMDRSITNGSSPILYESRMLMYTNDDPECRFSRRSQQMTEIGQFTFTHDKIIEYSKLTNNPHKIHLSKSYAQNIEHYPDIITQGPFILQVAAYWAAKHIHFNEQVATISYKNTNYVPAGCTTSISLNKTPGRLQVIVSDSNNPQLVYLTADLSTQHAQ